MSRATKTMALSAAAFLVVLGMAQPVAAQQYPPATPQPTPPVTPAPTVTPGPPVTPGPRQCVFAGTEGTIQEVRVGELFEIRGHQGCARPNEQGVEGYMESDPIFLGRWNANPDGSYRSTVRTPQVDPGIHQVVVVTQDNPYSHPIRVIDGIRDLGTTTDRLPRTGLDIMLLLLWAVALLALGTAIVKATKRWSGRASAAGASSTVSGSDAPPEVPFLDTSSFVPFRSRPSTAGKRRSPRRTRPESPAEEWDSARRKKRSG